MHESLDYSVEIEFSGIQAGIETVQNEKTKVTEKRNLCAALLIVGDQSVFLYKNTQPIYLSGQ